MARANTRRYRRIRRSLERQISRTRAAAEADGCMLRPRQGISKRCCTCCLRASENSGTLQCLIFRGSLLHPMQSLCTLRVHCRQRALTLLGPDFHRPDRTSLRLVPKILFFFCPALQASIKWSANFLRRLLPRHRRRLCKLHEVKAVARRISSEDHLTKNGLSNFVISKSSAADELRAQGLPILARACR
jgi:hypothetical protein